MAAAAFAAAPVNDNFAARITLTGSTATGTANTVEATKETGEPYHGGYFGGCSAWWTWTAPASGRMMIHTRGSNSTSLVLAVYTGSAVNALTSVASGTYESASGATVVRFNAVAGTTYQIAVDSSTGASTVQLNLSPVPANDNFANRITFTTSTTGSNVGATGESGEPGGGSSNSVWWTWTAPSAGQVTFATTTAFYTNVNVYTGTTLGALSLVGQGETNFGGGVANVTFTTVAGAVYQIRVNGYNDSGDIALSASLVAPPTNDNFSARLTLTGTNLTVTGSNIAATKQTGEPNHAGYAGGKSVWWTWTAPSSGPVTLDTRGSSFSSTLAVYTGTAVNSLIVVPDDPEGSVRYTSLLTFRATAGTAYQIAVDNYNGGSGAIVLKLRLPGNDDFADAYPLYGTSDSASNDNTEATKQTDEPSLPMSAGGKSVWWAWTAPYSGPVVVDTSGSSFDTILGVFTGSSVTALTQQAFDDDSGSTFRASKLTFNAVAGTTYYLMVDGYNGAYGTVALSVSQTPANDNFANRTSLTGAQVQVDAFNAGATKETGEPSHAGNAGGKSVWWSWLAPYSGPVTIRTYHVYYQDYTVLSSSSGLDTVLGVYTGSAVGSLTSVASAHDSTANGYTYVTFNAVGGTSYQIAVDGYNGVAGGIYLDVSLAPSNDTFALSTTLTGSSPSVSGASNLGASAQTGEPVHAAYGGGRSVWWSWTAPATATYELDTAGSDFNTAVAVYRGTAVNALTLIGKDGGAAGQRARIEFQAQAGLVYRFAIDGYGGTAGNIAFTLMPVPVIVTDPDPQVGVTIGQTASFGVTISGSNYTFRWQVADSEFGSYSDLSDGGPYSGVTTSSLHITPTDFSLDDKWYRCTVNFSGGSRSSTAGHFTVFALLRTFALGTQPVNQAVLAGDTATFTAAIEAVPEAGLSWFRKPAGGSTFEALSDDATYSGTQTGTLTVSNPTVAMSGDQFRCHAHQYATTQLGNNDEDSAIATLTVAPKPTSFYLSNTTFVYNGAAQTTTVLATVGGATYNVGGVVSATNVGNYTATATAFGNYTGSNNALAWSITAAPQAAPTITSAASVTFGTAYTATATSGFGAVQWQLGSGSTATGAAINASSGLITATSPGTVVIRARLAGDANHAASPYSADFTVTVVPAVTISQQPAGVTVAAGGNATFTVAATGNPTPTYQWQRLPAAGGSWANLANGGIYSGVTTSSLTLTGVALSNSGDQFRVVVSGTTTSSAATLTVTAASAKKDFNADGYSDVLWENSATGERAFWLLTGANQPAWLGLGQLASAWRMAAVADFSGDGKPDIVWENTSTGQHYLWIMNGTAYSSGANLATLPVEWRVVGAGDFNADGKADLLWENTSTGQRVIWYMNGTVNTGSTGLGSIPVAWHIAAVADFNADTKPDILWENTTTGDRSIWLMNGSTVASVVGLGTLSTQWRMIAAADFNGDAKTDILWFNSTTGELGCWIMNGTTYSDWLGLGLLPLDWNLAPVCAGDFNADGKVDILWQNLTTGDRGLWLMRGAAFPLWVRIGTVPVAWHLVGSADFNADGKRDLLWENTGTGQRQVWTLNGTVQSGTLTIPTIDAAWRIAAAADFNGDTKPDLLWQNTSTGDRVIWYMNGVTNTGSTGLGGIPVAWRIAGAADFNGDGQTDILWQNTSTGDLGIWLMNGANYLGWAGLGTIDPAWRIAGAADYNNDGQVDILWENTSTGERGYWIMNGTTNTGWFQIGVVPPAWKSGI